MTYQADDQSAAGSRPRELFAFETPTKSVYLTSFGRDVVAQKWDDALTNVTYSSVAGFGRTTLPVVTIGGSSDVSVDIPFEHPVAQEIVAAVRTMKRFHKVTILRQQATSGEVRRVWQGYVVSAAVDGRHCSLKIPNLVMDAIDTQVPTATVGRYCNNVLYDSNCRVNKASFSAFVAVTGTPTGPQLTVNTLGIMLTTNWYTNGMVEHPASGEKRSIVTAPSSGFVVTIDAPFPTDIWASSPNVLLYPGCDHTIDQVDGCSLKFFNRQNFGGLAQLPVSNPYLMNMLLSGTRS